MQVAVHDTGWILGLTVGLGAVGVFLDFYIGKKGNSIVKDWLVERWVRFDDLRWHNFSQKEATYFIAALDRCFGSKLLSARRWVSCTIFVAGCCAIVYFAAPYPYFALEFPYLSYLAFGLLLFASSLSISRAFSNRAILIALRHDWGPTIYLLLVLVNYVMLVVWRPLVLLLCGAVLISINLWTDPENSDTWPVIVQALWPDIDIKELADSFLEAEVWSPKLQLADALCDVGISPRCTYIPPPVEISVVNLLSVAAGVLRLLVSLGVLASFLLREWLSRFASTLWVRICESDKGAFTLILGAAGSVAGGLKAILDL